MDILEFYFSVVLAESLPVKLTSCEYFYQEDPAKTRNFPIIGINLIEPSESHQEQMTKSYCHPRVLLSGIQSQGLQLL